MSALRIAISLVLLSLLSACSSPDISQYHDKTPSIELADFFSGPLSAHGIVKNRSGEVIRTFNAELNGTLTQVNGQQQIELKERFVFDDGEVQFRDWQLIPDASTQTAAKDQSVRHYFGEAGDVVGPASVQVSGNAVFIQYTLRIPYKDGSIDVQVDDRMYRVDDTVIINESKLSKFGFNVGEIVLTIIKR